PTGSAPPAAPPPHAPFPQACSRSSEPAGTHARSRVVPCAAARPLQVRCERNMPASPIPQTWYACIFTLPHLVITGSPYKMGGEHLHGSRDGKNAWTHGRAWTQRGFLRVSARAV